MGTKLLYYLLLLPLSKLPYPLLYLLSNFVFFMIYRVFGYRKKVVLQNIKNAFPTKTVKEHQKIMTDFYRHLCDVILESVKCFSLKKEEALKRLVITNPEILDPFYKKGKEVVLVGGHYNNWEIFAVGMGLQIKHLPIGIYQPLTNEFLDKKMKATREKYRLKMCAIREVKELMISDLGVPKAPIFAIDQSPSNPNKSYWMNFLNQETSVHYGAEKYAKELNMPVVYGVIKKLKRGHYTVTLKVLSDNPLDEEYGYITQLATKELEKDIINNPQYWLWSHKRWKKARPEGVKLNKDLI